MIGGHILRVLFLSTAFKRVHIFLLDVQERMTVPDEADINVTSTLAITSRTKHIYPAPCPVEPTATRALRISMEQYCTYGLSIFIRPG